MGLEIYVYIEGTMTNSPHPTIYLAHNTLPIIFEPFSGLGLLMGWVEMGFMGWVLKWGVFGWVKMGCIS